MRKTNLPVVLSLGAVALMTAVLVSRDTPTLEDDPLETGRTVQETRSMPLTIADDAPDILLSEAPTPSFADDDDTLAGVDSDGNGVRDEIDRAIGELYEGDLIVQNIQTRGAKAMQAALLAGAAGDPVATETVGRETMIWTSCLVEHAHATGKPHGWAHGEVSKMTLLTRDTVERTQAAMSYERMRSGAVTESVEVDPALCAMAP